MRNSEKFLKTISTLIENGILSSKDVKKEISNDLKFTRDKLINKLDLVSREEFEVLKKMIQKQEKVLKKIVKKKKIKKVNKFLPTNHCIHFSLAVYCLHVNLLHLQQLRALNQPLIYLNFYSYQVLQRV